MAHIFPDRQNTRVIFVSQAEEQFYEACLTELPNTWRVYYSCTLSNIEPGQGLKDNEIDFLLYHPKYGLICAEVKGGRIEFDVNNNTFYSINRYDKRYEIKNPFQQVLNWKSRFLRYLRREEIKVPISHCVVFPKVEENEIPQTAEIEPALILGRNRLQNLEKALIDLVATSQPDKFLDFKDVAEDLDRIIRGTSFSTRLYLKDYLEAHDIRVKDVEYIHETLITPIASAKRLAVEGEAGTGKTMLALMLARHFRGQGRQVLFLSSNPFLNTYLKEELGSEVEVHTYTELSDSFGIDLLKKPANFQGTKEDWIQFGGPEKLREAIRNSAKRWDVLLCDEAQDVQPFWWESFETVLSQENEDARFYIFFDRSQGVFGSGGADETFVAEDVLPVKPPYFPLVHNYRNTREIAGFSRAFRTGTQILQSHSARLGYLPEIITYKDSDDCVAKLNALLNRLFEEEKLELSDVTLLSARRPFADGSVIHKTKEISGIKLVDLHDRDKIKKENIKDYLQVSTVASFKGLETSVGIIMNLSEYNLPLTNPIMSSLLYVACSRAKHMLFIMVREDDTKRDALRNAITKVEYTGSMLVEGSSADYEFNGVVTHYNPDRVGWLKVDDPAFEKNNIMFFPHDVEKANMPGLQVGAKVCFKPRVEGPVTIACDLKPVS